MVDFPLYFELGYQHILDLEGYDHILFIIALCGTYLLNDWKKVLILVTAFTIGHSITLALSVFNLVRVNTGIIEFLIPVTIVATALSNIFNKRIQHKMLYMKYTMALFFGLIHGMGFSNYLNSLLGKETHIGVPLFAFNVGIEMGQILIVLAILGISYLAIRVFKASQREWNLFLSSSIFGISLIMAIERIPF